MAPGRNTLGVLGVVDSLSFSSHGFNSLPWKMLETCPQTVIKLLPNHSVLCKSQQRLSDYPNGISYSGYQLRPSMFPDDISSR